MPKGAGFYCLDLPPSIAAVQPWFRNNFPKQGGPEPAGSPALKYDSYEVEAILQINKRGTHAKVKLMGYDSSQNQWFWLSELQDTAPEVVKAFLRGKERERANLKTRKRT